GAPKLSSKIIIFRDVDSKSNSILGEFATEVTVDNTSYLMTIHLVSDILIQHALIVSRDFLTTLN
ncbi:unnamed protein product, partial [Heterotrigona itama]